MYCGLMALAGTSAPSVFVSLFFYNVLLVVQSALEIDPPRYVSIS